MTRPTGPDPAQHLEGAGDPFAAEAGPYVLGSLAPPERVAFEAHLRTCAGCRREVGEVAALPGLLDQVPADLVDGMTRDLGLDRTEARPTTRPAGDAVVPHSADATRPSDDVAPPPLLLADLLRRARTERAAGRRRRIAGAFAAAAVLVGALAVSTGDLPLPWQSPVPSPTVAAEAIELAQVVPSPVTASVRLDGASWGTKIDLECGYAADGMPSGGYGGPARDYALVVWSSSGTQEQVATWSVGPGEDITVPAATAIHRAEIVSVELRAADGTVLLRADT